MSRAGSSRPRLPSQTGTTKTVRTYDLEQARDLLRGAILMAVIQLTFFFLPTLLAAVMPGSWNADGAWKTTVGHPRFKVPS